MNHLIQKPINSKNPWTKKADAIICLIRVIRGQKNKESGCHNLFNLGNPWTEK